MQTVDRNGKVLGAGQVVSVLPFNTRPDNKNAEELGIEFYGVVLGAGDGYVTVSADDPGRGTVGIRSDLVIVIDEPQQVFV